ncbi:hypothetical protein JCM31271_25790 [Halorubrum trueperi]
MRAEFVDGAPLRFRRRPLPGSGRDPLAPTASRRARERCYPKFEKVGEPQSTPNVRLTVRFPEQTAGEKREHRAPVVRRSVSRDVASYATMYWFQSPSTRKNNA